MNRKFIFIILLLITLTNIFTVYHLSKAKNKISALEYDLLNFKNESDKSNELYDLRNQLDNMLHITINSLIQKDFQTIQNNFYKNCEFTGSSIIFNHEETNKNIEFIIPDTDINLRQRAFDLISENEYISIYEILDSGYKNEPKYSDRIYTLNVKFIFDNTSWKIASISIDE